MIPTPNLLPPRRRDLDRWLQALSLRRRCLDLLHHVHSFDHRSEGRKALAIRISFPAEVELRLVVDADEKTGCGRIGGPARHRKSTVLVCQSRPARTLQLNRGKHIFPPRGVYIALYDFNLDLVFWLVVHCHRAEESAAIVELAINVFHEVLGSDWCVHTVNSKLNCAKLGLQHDDDVRFVLLRSTLRPSELEKKEKDEKNSRYVFHACTFGVRHPSTPALSL